MQKFSCAIVLGIVSSILAVSPALSGSRYSTPSATALSSDLASPWLLQLENKPGQNKKLRLKVAPIVRPARPQFQSSVTPMVTPIRKKQVAAPIAPRPQRINKIQQTPVAKKKSSQMEDRLLPQMVNYETVQPAGTIIIATNQRYLYHVMGNGKARRYGIGVGRQGFTWSGTQKISRKAKWPGWTPPAEMIAREKKKGKILPAHMPGGPNNPLGARALYLGSSLYRIHGTTQPSTIGKAVSSGCIRMRNEDVIDLYTKVNVGTKVIVL